jgi:orotidine-5'-phosphate decarboxylase
MSDARDHMCLVLDVGGLPTALELATRLQPWFGIAKVGMELYAEAGPEAIEALQDKGFRVFADLKMYDIPNTLDRAARVHGRRGVTFLNFPAAVGSVSLRAGVEGFLDGARDGGHPVPIALGVTVLTSEPDTRELEPRMDIARDAGCAGVVCAGSDVPLAVARGLHTMVPGIRPAGVDANDQARVDTPADAITRGADWLVIGRAVTAVDDPEAAADAIARDVGRALVTR